MRLENFTTLVRLTDNKQQLKFWKSLGVILFLQPFILVKLPDLELFITNKRTVDVLTLF